MTAAARKTEADTTAALLGLANATKSKAADGSLDTGYNIARMGLQAAHAACVTLFMSVHERMHGRPCGHRSLPLAACIYVRVYRILYP